MTESSVSNTKPKGVICTIFPEKIISSSNFSTQIAMSLVIASWMSSWIYCIWKWTNLNLVFETKNLNVSDCRRHKCITVTNWSGSSLLTLDATINSPLQTSLIAQTVEEPGDAASTVEEREIGHFDEHCHRNGITFIHSAMESSAALR